VRELYKRYESGASLRNLQDWLEENQIKTVLGESKWTTTSIKSILTNEKYCGDVLMQKTYTVDCLTHKTKHLGMTTLSKYNNLRIGIGIILSLYTALQGKHHRTCSIDYLDVVLFGKSISLRRFAMSTQQHLDTMQRAHVLMVDGDEPLLVQTLHLHTIVNNVAKTIEARTLGKLLLSLLDGSGDTEAEATALVDFY